MFYASNLYILDLGKQVDMLLMLASFTITKTAFHHVLLTRANSVRKENSSRSVWYFTVFINEIHQLIDTVPWNIGKSFNCLVLLYNWHAPYLLLILYSNDHFILCHLTCTRSLPPPLCRLHLPVGFNRLKRKNKNKMEIPQFSGCSDCEMCRVWPNAKKSYFWKI